MSLAGAAAAVADPSAGYVGNAPWVLNTASGSPAARSVRGTAVIVRAAKKMAQILLPPHKNVLLFLDF